MNKSIQRISWILLILGGLISMYLFIDLFISGFWIWGKTKPDYALTGQVGDFIGGIIGTIFALSGTLLIFLNFQEQIKQNKKDRFEATFFEMIRLHRQNVSEMNYEKYANSKFNRSENRKVFRIIFQEFLECFREVKKFSNSKDINDYLTNRQRRKLEVIIKNNNEDINIIELAIIDIAYSIVYYGIGKEGEIILRDKFKQKYRPEYFYPLIKYIKLKPKLENKKRWLKWEKLISYPFKQFKSVNKEFYDYREHLGVQLSVEASDLLYKKDYNKYYGGHQHRLGHYFQHLFQSYKYLNYHLDLTQTEKFFYAKTLRAQLSSYEQALLFINSLSSLGMKWEYTPEYELLNKNEEISNSKLISRYDLIKNLPGNHFFGLTYKLYYPLVKFES